jgi:ubiquinone/menaquinone biosynthesis C-methylase UbiE/uncharacterized protein YbaR (Trm112 family)
LRPRQRSHENWGNILAKNINQIKPQQDLLEALACPICKTELEGKAHNGEMQGFLFCRNCKRDFKIIEGIPDLLLYESQELSKNKENHVSFSIKKANMDYGKVYRSESTATSEAINISTKYLIPRGEEFIVKQLKGSLSVLETCCAGGTTASYLYNAGYNPFCFDISLESLRVFKEHYPYITRLFLADAENLPLLNNYFDAVIFNASLHHLPNPRRAFVEAFRVLKTGGRVVLVEPNSDRNEIARILLKLFVHPKSAFKDVKRTWYKVINSALRKDKFEYDGKTYQKDNDGRWIKHGEMDLEISLSYVLRVAKSLGFRVNKIQTHDISILFYRLLNNNPDEYVWRRFQKIDSVLKKIPLINRIGETMYIVFLKPS